MIAVMMHKMMALMVLMIAMVAIAMMPLIELVTLKTLENQAGAYIDSVKKKRIDISSTVGTWVLGAPGYSPKITGTQTVLALDCPTVGTLGLLFLPTSC
jgi:hypothetical protein